MSLKNPEAKDHEVIILTRIPRTMDEISGPGPGTTGTIITNDFNLNKVAELRGVKCLNLNKPANALKPAVYPEKS
jgi:hypothetical protein